MWVLGFVLAALAIAGCGKKGPPLAPIVHVPAAVDKLAARRIGNDVYLTLTIPTQNIDSSTPADVSRVDVYAVTTSTPPPRARVFEVATRVASVDVAPAPRPGDSDVAPADVGSGAPLHPSQGTVVVLRDTLTPADLVPKALPAAGPRAATAPAAPATAAPTDAASFPRRYYIALALNDRGRQGPPGALVDLPLVPLPDPPGQPSLAYTEDAVSIAWPPSGGLVGFFFERAIPLEPPPVEDVRVVAETEAPANPAGPILYNVYRERVAEAPGEPLGAAAPWDAVVPAPINPVPVAGLMFTDMDQVVFGRERCYTVRAVRGAAPNLVIGEPSVPACATPEDRFPPLAPTGLAAVAAEGSISLIWEPNGEADLGGYVVLRGQAGDATLQRLTNTPVTDTRYVDRAVMPGVRYVYAVQALDTHAPDPNVSEESNRVEETAR